MTWRQIPAALKTDGLTPVEKLVLVGLVYIADQHGQNSYPSQQTLAGLCNVGPSTIKRAMRKLRGMELITPTGKGRKGTVRYTINLSLSALPRIRGVPTQAPVKGHERPTIHCKTPVYKKEGNIVIDRFSDIGPMQAMKKAWEREG